MLSRNKKRLKRKIKNLFLEIITFLAAALVFLGMAGIECDVSWQQILIMEGLGLSWLCPFIIANQEILGIREES